MTPFIANPDAFGKDRRNEACLPKGCFLPEGRVSSNRPGEIDRNKCECENEKIANSPVSKGVGRYWIKINRPWICDSFEQNTLSIFHSLDFLRLFCIKTKETKNIIWNEISAPPPQFDFVLQNQPPFSVETMFCHKYLRFRFTPPSPSRCFYSGELFILHPFRACRKTNRPSQFGRSVIRQSRRRERNTNTNQISCPYSPCFFNRLK